MTEANRRTWDLLRSDFTRAASADFDTRIALVDAWTAYIVRLEEENAALKDLLATARTPIILADDR
jgi:hypothetical protein